MDMELIDEASLVIKDNITSLLYYPALNVLCLSLEDAKLAFIEASSANFVKVIDIPANDGPFCLNVFKERLVVCKNQTFNARGDINGTFLVDSLFQGPISDSESPVIIDLPCVEATQLLKLIQGYRPENMDDDGEKLIFSLMEAIEKTSSQPKPSHKIAKWETITLRVKHSTFTKLLQDVLHGLPNANIAGVPVLASVLDRLNNLTLSDEESRMMVLSGEKNVMNNEANRRMTFSKWPHMNYKWALPDQMAQAGFFHKPAGSESDDRALCFLCNICLVSWEPTDEPWSEHERHSSTCPFVKAEFTTNIPLSVTYATEPARYHSKHAAILSNTNSNKLIATASKSGDFTIWDLSLKNRKASEFSLSYFPLFSYDKEHEFSQCIEIHSACIIDRWRANRKNGESEAHTLVVGARLKHYDPVSRFLNWPLSCSLQVTRELESRSHEDEGAGVFLLVFDLVQITQDEFSELPSEFKNPFLPDPPPPASPNSEDMEWKPPSYEAAMEEKEIKYSFLRALNLEDIGEQSNTNSVLLEEQHFPSLLPQSNTSSSVSRKIAMLNYDIPYIFADYSVHLKQMLPLVIGDKLCSPNCEVANIMPTITGAGKGGVLINVRPSIDSAGEFDSESSGGLILYPYLEFQTSELELLLDPSPSLSMPLSGGECARSLCIVDSELTDSISTDSDDTIGATNNESNRAYEQPTVNCTEASTHSDEQMMVDEAPTVTNYPPWILLSMSGDIVAVNANSFDYGSGKSTHRVKNSSGRSTCSVSSNHIITKFSKLLLPAAQNTKDRFTAIEYCTGMDRLCGVTSGGQIHLFQIIRNETDDNRDLLESSGQAIKLVETDQPSVNQKNTPLPTDTSDFLAHNKPLEHLVQLHDLIQYDLLQARIDTSLPRCWVELKQDQLTRQPQSAPNITQSNEMGNTFSRSWTLIRDIGTWEEHVIELGLPKVVCVGHIDVKIHLDDLQGEPAPNIFVTLLRQNVSNVNLDSGMSSRNLINGESSYSESVHSSASQSVRTGLISNAMDSALPIVDLDAPYMDDAPTMGEVRTAGRFQEASPISQEQLRQLHADVIAGPYCLADYLDLSGHVAIIPMTSAELIKCRSRLFAIHIKAVGEKPDQDYNDQISDIANRDNPPPSPRPYKKKHSRDTRGRTNGVSKVLIQNTPTSNSYIVTNSSSSNANNFDDNGNAASSNNPGGIQESGCVAWKGCDIIRQLSVTVRKFKRTSLHQERAQRLAILRSRVLHETLLDALANPNPTLIANESDAPSACAYLMGVHGVTALPHLRHLLINMLNWIALMYLNELNGKNRNILNLLTLCADHVDEIIVTLLIGGDRSIAKKIAKLFISFIELDKHLNDGQSEHYIFTPKLHQVLKYRLELLLLAESSVGVGWYFLLLDRLDREMDSGETTKIKAKFLEKLVKTYRERNAGFEATVLRSEFGLFHNPLEANLFDVDYQLSYKLGSTTLPGNKSATGSAGPQSYAQAVMIGPNAGGNVSHIFPQAAVPIQTVHGNIANLLNSHLTAAGLQGVPSAANGKPGVNEEVIQTFGEQVFIKDVLKMIKQAANNLMGSSNRKSNDSSDIKKDSRKKHLRNMSSIDDLQIFQSRGLIEAEPLHVSCSSTSEGTRLEKIDSQSGLPTVVPILTNSYPPYLQPSQAASFSNLPYNPMKDLKSTKLQILKKQMNEASKLSTKKNILPFTSAASVPPTPKTTPATTTQSTPMHITPSVTPPNEVINSCKLSSNAETVKDPANNDKTSLLSNNSLLNTDLINHTLMTSPELHQLVVERMHPGARRYVVLSFGKPVLLTDILVPACSELTSFSIDVSLLPQDDSEFQRIIVSTDIANHPLIVTNVEPPILCQYVKITIVGRMGTTANKARIPLGSFFGHSMVFPWEVNLSTCAVDSHHHGLSKPKKNMQLLESNTGSGSLDQDIMLESSSSHSSAHLSKVSLALNRLKAISEDMACRYGLSSYQLVHLISSYKATDSTGSNRLELAVQIRQVYEQCADLQRQLNVIRCTFQRLGGMVSNHVGLTVESTDKFIQDQTPLYQQACTDKIRCLTEFCLQSLLSQNCSAWNNLEEISSFEQISLSSNLMAALPEPDTLKQLFLNLIVFGNKSMQIMSVGLLSHMCSVASITNQINFTQWWSNWIRQVLNSFFTSSPTWMVPQNRIFVLLCAIIQQMIISGLGRLICDDLLHFLNGLLQPLMSSDLFSGAIDQELLNWVLLLTNTTLDYIPKEFSGSEHSGCKSFAIEGRDTQNSNRWDFLTWHHTQSKEENNKKSRVELSKLYRRKLHKRLLHHKQKLLDLKKAKEEFMNSQKQSESESQISQQQAKVWIRKKTEEEFNKHFNILTQKHMKDLMQLKKNEIDLCRRFDKKFPPHNSLSGMNYIPANSNTGGPPNHSNPRPLSPSGSHLTRIRASPTLYSSYSDVPLVPYSAVKPVVTSLFVLLRRMDSTVNQDLFLRTCKVIGRLMTACQPSLRLGEVISSGDLYELLERACQPLINNMSVSFAGHYGLHALACLMADLLEMVQDEASITTDMPPHNLKEDSTNPGAVAESFDAGSGNEEDEDQGLMAQSSDTIEKPGSAPEPPPIPTSTNSNKDHYFFIDYPEVLDSDTDTTDYEFLADVHEVSNYVPGAPLSTNSGYLSMTVPTTSGLPPMQRWPGLDSTLNEAGLHSQSNTPLGITASYDIRAENSLELRVDLQMIRWSAQLAYRAETAVNSLCPPADIANLINGQQSSFSNQKSIQPTGVTVETTESADKILQLCLNNLFCNVSKHNLLLDPVLQFWLYLNQDYQNSQWSPKTVPYVPLSQGAVIALLEALTSTYHLPTLHLGLSTLTLACNQKGDKRVVAYILSSNEMRDFMLHLLMTSSRSTASLEASQSNQNMGPATLDIMQELLNKLRLYCADLNTSYIPFVAGILMRLIQENGALSLGYGPKDLQCKFILMASNENFSCCEQNIRLNIIDNIARLTKAHMNSNFNFQLVNRYGSNDFEKSASCFTSISSAGLLLKQNPDRSYKALCSRHRIITGLMSLMNNIICHCSTVTIATDCSKQSEDYISDDQKKEEALDNDMDYQTEHNLSDIVIRRSEPLENLIYCLTACHSSQLNVTRDVALPELAAEIFESLQPRSVGDWILVVMTNIFKYCSDKSAFLNIVLETMKSPYFEIHEPFLLFAIWMLSAHDKISSLNNTTCLRYFVENKGLNTICKHLVKSCRYVLGSGTSLLHSTEVALAMTFSAMSGQLSASNSPLDPLSGNASSSGNKATVTGGIGVPSSSHYSWTSQNLVPLVQRKSSQDNGQSGPVIDGLVNFSPYCTISSGSSTGSSGPETLLQPIGPCRRSKPANWTYNFFPDEAFIELTIKLPCVVLLQEIMIQPHVALTSAPSAVSLEFRRFGCIVYPLSPPIDTSGLSQIRLTFSPTLANEVLLRFHKPKNSDALGLTHILVKGRSLFSPVSSNSTNESLASLTHLRLLEFILQYAECGLVGELTQTIEQIPDLLVYLCSLLTKKFSEATTVEQILLKLGTGSFVASEKILQCLLKAPTAEFGPVFYRSEESEANHSTENLLYKLGIQDDEHSEARVQLMLNWLRLLSASQDSEAQAKMLVPARHIYVLSVILWHWAVEKQKVYDSWKKLLDPNLIQFVFQWTYSLPPQNGKMRSALSCLLCSMTVLKPGTFSCLLKWMNIVGMSSMTDDIKQQYNLSVHTQLENICRYGDLLVIIAQADANVQELLASGVLELVTSQLNHFFTCHLEMSENYQLSQSDNAKKFGSLPINDQQCISPRVAIQSLRLLFQIANADWRFKNWLGQSQQATLFWSPLILLFCSQNHFLNSPESTSTADGLFYPGADSDVAASENVGNLSSDLNNPRPCKIARNASIQPLGLSERIDLESAAIDFFKAITKFSDINQNRFSVLLCETLVGLKENSDALCLPDFLRRLLLQVLLEDPSIPVLLSCDNDLFHQKSSSANNPADLIISSQGKSDQIFLHPRYGAGYNSALKTVSSFTTLSSLASDVLEMSHLHSSAFSSPSKSNSIKRQKFGGGSDNKTSSNNYASPSKDADTNFGLDLIDQISSSSGINLKDLNQSNYSYKNTDTSNNSDSNENISTNKSNASLLTVSFIDPDTNAVFPPESSLNDIISYYFRKKHNGFSGYLNLQVTIGNHLNRSENVYEPMTFGLDEPTLTSPLESFIKIDGLIMLAELLHLLYPGIRKLASSSPSVSNPTSASTGKSFGVGGPGAPASSYWPMDQWPDDYYDVDLDAMEPYYGQAADFYPPNKRNTTATAQKPGLPLLPAHTLIAFALFLRVPGYAEMLIQDWRESLYLLRLLLGVNEDADGVDFLARNSELPLLPFRVLKRLYQQHPPGTDDAALLRLKTLDFGILDLELTCLSVLSHQPPSVANAHNQIISITMEDLQNQLQSSASSSATSNQASSNLLNSMMAGSTALSEEKKHYWAKGTGFSTGTVSSTWDSEFALLRQKLEEEHCTVILEVVASFLYPHDDVMLNGETDCDFTLTFDLLPATSLQMLRDSCLLAVMASYLRNDSVLDMARHVPLYQSLLAVLRSLARIPELHCLLQPQDPKGGSLDIGALLSSMKSCVDTYANRLRKAPTVPKSVAHRGKLTRQMAVRKLNHYKMIEDNRQNCKKRSDESNTESDNESENLAQLIPDIQRTAKLVALALKKSADIAAAQEALGLQAKLMEVTDEQATLGFIPICEGMSSDVQFDQMYCAAMKPLQFGMYQMVKEDEEGNISFTVPHHYEHMVRHAGNATQSSSRARRLAQETVTLSTSLPLSSGSTVMVRCDEERLDLMKVLIIGPPDTPYANGAFEFDVFFPMDYPNSPPLINLQTTGNHSVRFNPNLYNEGKVCLSILNTWHGRPEERWNAKTSSFLQVLVSIQSLILVPEPYFNEPGYERSRGTPSGTQASKDYDANIRQATVKWAVLEMIKNPPASFRDAILKHFALKKTEILNEIQTWITEYSACSEKNQNSTKSATKHAYIQLKKYFRQLKEEYAKIEKKPIIESSSTSGNNSENKSLEPTEV